MRDNRVIIIGAGIGGLAAALKLAACGHDVTVVEKQATPGGKMRALDIGGALIDAGPTVLTLADVFEALFEETGARLEDYVTLKKASLLARHAFDQGGDFDLFADQKRSADAIGQFAGARDAKGYLAFCAEAEGIYRVLERTFIRAQKPNLAQLMGRVGLFNFADLWRINPYETLWHAVCRHMADDRLRRLFARYATYCGSSPFKAPATLMLVAHVESQGVFLVEGGMRALVSALHRRAQEIGVTFRFDAPVRDVLSEGGAVRGVKLATGEDVSAPAVFVNADCQTAASGALGATLQNSLNPIRPNARSLSALTWAMCAIPKGFSLARHTIFFPRTPYAAEFDALFKRGAFAEEPTVYICAQDRDDEGGLLRSHPALAPQEERLLLVVNAPALVPSHSPPHSEIERCEKKMFGLLQRCGLDLKGQEIRTIRTTPQDFEKLFPGTGGAIYGRASHGWRASFQRQGARGRLKGLYFSGGSIHPGPGAPMAALSGHLGAQAYLSDYASANKLHRAAMPGGISMPSATTAATD